jgi:uncharacterized membrane protein
MDQGQLSNLDPKLKEAYERIMGTAVAPQTQTPAAVVQPKTAPEQPAAQSFAQPVIQHSVPPIQQQPQHPQPIQTPPVIAEPAVSQPSTAFAAPSMTNSPLFDTDAANDQIHAYVASEVAGAKQSLKLIQVMYLVGGLVFFVVYAFFWMKFFNLALPL